MNACEISLRAGEPEIALRLSPIKTKV